MDPTGSGDEEPDFQPVFENRVRYAETDAQGIVFYGEYFTYQDETFLEFLRAVGYGWEDMVDRGWETHVANAELNYREGATFGDTIVNELRLAEFGESSFTFEYRARREEDGAILVEGTLTQVAVDHETGETIRVPDEFREAVAAFQGGREAAE